MPTPVTNLGLAGRRRRASYDHADRQAAHSLVPADATLEPIEGFPES